VSIATRREIGAARRRVEDPRLVQGAGQYVEDLRLPGTVDVAFVRSGYAHARIKSVDLDAARRAPGVVAAWSGERVKDTPRLPVRILVEGTHVSPLPPLAHEVVTTVGYPVAAVVATDRYLARDAADLVEVEYEPLPAVTEAERAMEPDAPILYPEFGTNVAYHVVREGGDVEGAFARADHGLRLRLDYSRLAQIPLEARAILASYDRDADLLTVWRSTQSPFATRQALSVGLRYPEEKIRVIAPDVGGAFGSKSPVYPDELTVALLAMELGVPVRWVSTRMEDLQLTMQGRDQVDTVEAAFTNDGIITALKVRTVSNFGAFHLPPTSTPPLRMPDYATGAYRIPALRSEVFGVYTNTAPVGPYRGAGRPEAAFVAERVIEEAARTLGLDPVEIRRRNFIRPDEFPYITPNGAVYDSGDYERAMDRALEIVGYEQVRERQRRARERGPHPQPPPPSLGEGAGGGGLLGIGLSTTIEVSAQGFESGRVEVEPDGTVVARTGSSSHGQGHETSFAQVVADQLQVPFEKVRIVHGDTAETPVGIGTFGSRSMTLGGGALAVSAEQVKKQALRVAASLLETSPADLVYAQGGVQVVGAPERRVGLAEIAQAARAGAGMADGQRGLSHENRFEPGGDAVPFGTTIAVVRVDRETGRVALERLVAVDDCGTVINHLIVDGQIAGSLTQGVAQALYERVLYDDDGQLLTASLLDYAVPTAHMVPKYELDLTETPSPNNPLGAKGIGESGCVGAPPAVVNAVLDALAPLGITNLDMPLTSDKVWRAIRTAESRA
jgi:carbon-monoxide dehydrogenase large subunit